MNNKKYAPCAHKGFRFLCYNYSTYRKTNMKTVGSVHVSLKIAIEFAKK